MPDGISIPGLPSGQGGSDGSGWHGTETDGANTPGTIAGTDRGSGPHIHCVPRTLSFYYGREFREYRQQEWVEHLLRYGEDVMGHPLWPDVIVLGKNPFLSYVLLRYVAALRSVKWYLTDREYREEEDELTWELEDEYGLIPEIRLLPEAADYDRVRLEATAPCLVLDFSDSDKVYGGGLAAGSVWLDFPASEEKERRVTSGCPQIRYFSMKKSGKTREKPWNTLTPSVKMGIITRLIRQLCCRECR